MIPYGGLIAWCQLIFYNDNHYKGSLKEFIYGSHHLLRPHSTMQGKARRAVVPFYDPF